MKRKSLKKNAIWNLIFTGSNLLSPMITAPYVSRVLGATNLGKVDFARSFAQWFVLFAAFGVTIYGMRSISQVQKSQEELNKVFSELFFLNLFFSILSLALYLLIIFSQNNLSSELPLLLVMAISIVLNAVNIDWFYRGIEEYDYITKRNVIIKLVSLFLIFVLVRDSEDYILYGFISVLGIGLSGILNLANSRKYAKLITNKLNFRRHLRSLITFFLSTFIINIYTNLDQTLLGFISVPSAVAFMTRGKTVTTMGAVIGNSITTVAMPRASYYLKTNISEYKKLVKKVPNYTLILTVPISVGIFSLAPEIMYILGGAEFMEASNLLRVLSIVVVLLSLSSFLEQQILVPNGSELYNLFASIIASIVSVLANIIMIPKYGYMGAGYAMLLAESSAFCSRYLFVKLLGFDYINFVNKSTKKYVIASFGMLIPICIIKFNIYSLLMSFSLSVLLGAIIYFVILLILKEQLATEIWVNFIRNSKSND